MKIFLFCFGSYMTRNNNLLFPGKYNNNYSVKYLQAGITHLLHMSAPKNYIKC